MSHPLQIQSFIIVIIISIFFFIIITIIIVIIIITIAMVYLPTGVVGLEHLLNGLYLLIGKKLATSHIVQI